VLTFKDLPDAVRDRLGDVVVKDCFHIEGAGVTGYHFKLANGWTVSVQFGPMTHSSNELHLEALLTSLSDPGSVAFPDWSAEATTAEIAAITPSGSMYEFPDGSTEVGWQDVDEVMAFIEEIADQPGKNQP